MFRSHVIGGEPIALTGHKSLLRAATENFIEKPNNILLDLESEPRTSSVVIALRTTRLTRHFFVVIAAIEMHIL